MLYREAIHLQCFMPTCYVKNREYPSCTRIFCQRPFMFIEGSHMFTIFYTHVLHEKRGHARAYSVDDLCSNSTVGCMLALYGPTMQLGTLN